MNIKKQVKQAQVAADQLKKEAEELRQSLEDRNKRLEQRADEALEKYKPL